MPYCPNGHGEQSGRFCPECGAALSASPPPPGDAIRIRSPQAHAAASVSPTFVLPGGVAEAPPVYVKCPWCGRRNLEAETFDCQGACGRQNLCLRHFDEEYEVCRQCATALRGEDQTEVERQAKLQAELECWRRRAEAAEARVGELTDQGQQNEAALAQARDELETARARIAALEQELAGWQQRAERAEARLADIERREQEAEEARQREEEQKKKAPIWQQIGIDLVKIPAGEFQYGDNKARVNLPEYWIARTPVTNAQYKAFVEATGHPPPEHWKEGKIPHGKENHPVMCVSWHDAVAFCQWAGLLLPTEQDWEKAARGTDGREYPWGNQTPYARHCNFNQNVNDTTPVGQYPMGASPYGCLDMAGNVWEWCADWYEVGKSRVVRGGSWYDGEGLVRAADRVRAAPDDRDSNVGFRCVSQAP